MPYKDSLRKIDDVKHQIDACQAPQHAINQLKDFYRIANTYTSNALEGNSLTEAETKIIIEDGLVIGGKSLRDHLEVVGHSDAYTYMWELVKEATITEHDILKLHHLFYYRINEAEAGHYRKNRVMVTGSDFEFPSPQQVPLLMRQFADSIGDLALHNHPVIYAALLHLKFVTIHPFIDGNGRTARLLMNVALLQKGYCITSIPLVLRSDYIAALRAFNNGDDKKFLTFIVSAVYESHLEYQRLLSHLTQRA